MHVARTAVIGHDTCIGAGTYLEDACQVCLAAAGGICSVRGYVLQAYLLWECIKLRSALLMG